MQQVPLIETEGGSADSKSGSSDDPFSITSASGSGPDGLTLTLSMADGSEVVLTREDLLLLTTGLQTFLLLYVTWKEATS